MLIVARRTDEVMEVTRTPNLFSVVHEVSAERVDVITVEVGGVNVRGESDLFYNMCRVM